MIHGINVRVIAITRDVNKRVDRQCNTLEIHGTLVVGCGSAGHAPLAAASASRSMRSPPPGRAAPRRIEVPRTEARA